MRSIFVWCGFVLPGVITFGSIFGAFGILGFPVWIQLLLAGCSSLGLLFLLVTMVVWFTEKRWGAGVAATGCLIVSLASIIPARAVEFFRGMESEMAGQDDFAVNLRLPEGVKLLEPVVRPRDPSDLDADGWDPFQRALRQSLEVPGTLDPTITPSVPSLAELQRNHPDLLKLYLSVHPAWWYHNYRGNPFATRRWKVDGHWQHNLHGYYSSFFPEGSERYQTRTCLSLSGKNWNRYGRMMATGVEAPVPLSKGNSLHESYICWNQGGILVELFEQAETEERRMTKATIRELENEFGALLKDPTWKKAKTLLPEGAIVRGEESFAISGTGGIYHAHIRCNPGEPGRLYLKAYEITGGTPLSENRLKKNMEYVGWSKDPQEKFLSDFQFTIYEGEWGQYYGARLEVWFEPDNGGSDRKLMESNWKIEGWTR